MSIAATNSAHANAATRGGAVSTRNFIPHRCHAAIGVSGAISVATACLLPASPAAEVAAIPGGATKRLSVEHPTGALDVLMELDEGAVPPEIRHAAFLQTARKLFQGIVFGRDGS
ncbi:MAG: PrpF domain-containing protein [Kiloniellaceae bacterium]